MDEADVPERSLAELSSLLGAGAAPQGITVPVFMAVRALRDQRAINDFRHALESVFSSSSAAPRVAEDEMKADAERKALFARLAGGLNALHYFLKQLDMQNLSNEFDELRSALEALPAASDIHFLSRLSRKEDVPATAPHESGALGPISRSRSKHAVRFWPSTKQRKAYRRRSRRRPWPS
jgi:hypothetical protein